MDRQERDELVDLVAQAVIDKLEERERVNQLAELVVRRVLALQAEEAALSESEDEIDGIQGKQPTPKEEMNGAAG